MANLDKENSITYSLTEVALELCAQHEFSQYLSYRSGMNSFKRESKVPLVVPGNKSNRIATRLVQRPMVIGKRRLTAAQRRAILDAMLKAA